jgi:subtilase family serine protease
VAIVDAFDDPNAENDLDVYRAQFGLAACTTANGCFSKVDQNGGNLYPSPDAGWAQEISLDLDMVSAICPNCHILLVEANSNSFADLAAAANYAGTHASSNSHSYGGGEAGGVAGFYGSNYQHQATTASSGDSGNTAPQFPADLSWVTAVGGTSLTSGGGARGWTETAWSGAGSACSGAVAKPSWQSGINTGCGMRAYSDVAAVADPNTGVDVYDSYQASGWLVFGGTSVASPIIASVYALAGNASSIQNASFAYSHTASLFDVTSGSNGHCGAPLCVAGTGWDGPTGLGSPNGTGAF